MWKKRQTEEDLEATGTTKRQKESPSSNSTSTVQSHRKLQWNLTDKTWEEKSKRTGSQLEGSNFKQEDFRKSQGSGEEKVIKGVRPEKSSPQQKDWPDGWSHGVWEQDRNRIHHLVAARAPERKSRTWKLPAGGGRGGTQAHIQKDRGQNRAWLWKALVNLGRQSSWTQVKGKTQSYNQPDQRSRIKVKSISHIQATNLQITSMYSFLETTRGWDPPKWRNKPEGSNTGLKRQWTSMRGQGALRAWGAHVPGRQPFPFP